MEDRDEGKGLVVKSNHLVEAAYHLTVAEQRLVLSCIRQVRHDEPLTDSKFYSVHASEFAELFGTDITTAYHVLAEAAEKLTGRKILLSKEPDGKTKPKNKRIAVWVQTSDYIPSEGRVEIEFGKRIIPYLSSLAGRFTKYDLGEIAALTSTYAIRLFEFLVQWEKMGSSREIEIAWLRETFMLEKSYPAIKDLKKRVIDPAVEQINRHTTFQVKWTQRKTGRNVTHITFHWTRKKPAKAIKADPKTKALPPREQKLYGYPVSLLEKHRQYADEPLEDVVPRMAKVAAEA